MFDTVRLINIFIIEMIQIFFSHIDVKKYFFDMSFVVHVCRCYGDVLSPI